MKRWKGIIILSLLILVIGVALVGAEESADQNLPPRARILQILQSHPEVWEEIQALGEEFQVPTDGEDEYGFFGMMRRGPMGRGRMMSRNRGYCRQALPEGVAWPGWNR